MKPIISSTSMISRCKNLRLKNPYFVRPNKNNNYLKSTMASISTYRNSWNDSNGEWGNYYQNSKSFNWSNIGMMATGAASLISLNHWMNEKSKQKTNCCGIVGVVGKPGDDAR